MLSKQLDKNLLHLAWSLWTELGVAGVKQNHKTTLVPIEELILFTSALIEIDPRLRDESLDWCSQFHHFISMSRLKSLMKDFEEVAREPFSIYAATLNSVSKENWPTFTQASPLKVALSRKSALRSTASPGLLNVRARSIFGTGARADLVAFFLVHPDRDFSISDIAAIGYSKRNLAEILDDLHFGHLLERFMQRNQHRYRLNSDSPLFQILKPIPTSAPAWHLIFKVLLVLRDCICRIENVSETTKVVEIRNCVKNLEKILQELGLIPPSFQNDFAIYLESFSQWILEWTNLLAKGLTKFHK